MAGLKRGKAYAAYLSLRKGLRTACSGEFWKSRFLYIPMLGPVVHSLDAKRISETDQRRLDFYGQFVNAGDLVFDVGANVGNRTKVFLALGANVVAFEPQHRCAKLLKTTWSGNQKFTLIESALGAKVGRGVLYLSNASPLSSMSTDWIEQASRLRFASYRWNRKQEVDVLTLDTCISSLGAPSFIKIDVEGFEYEVLSGLSAPVRCLSFEYTPECLDAAVKCLDLLDKLGGFEYQFSSGESMRLELSHWVNAEGLKEHLSISGVRDFGDIYARTVSGAKQTSNPNPMK